MSRIGKQPIIIPDGVELTIENNTISAKGPKGELSIVIHPQVLLERDGQIINVKVKNEENKFERSIWGTSRKLISNVIEGVTKGFEKKLEVNGVGYNASVSGNKLVLKVGYSHPVDFDLPQGITATIEKNVITLNSIDKQLLGDTAAQIRSVRKPEPYKGKGIKYSDEQIRRKAGKAAAKAG